MADRDNPLVRKEGGRGRPPLHSRFQKGQSGNPKGRPPKVRDFKKLIETELDNTVSLTENGKRVRLTKREVIAKKLVNDAARGEDKALGHLLKMLAGGSEPENPTVAVDPAELARFALRYLRPPEATSPGTDDTGPDTSHAGGDGEDANCEEARE